MTELGDRKKFYILIVEDDRPLAGGLCRALQNDSTLAVGCHTLREAEELLDGEGRRDNVCAGSQENSEAPMENEGAGKARSAFDLVVLDVNLPDGNGFDFLQKIKGKYDISVIMLTANDMETDIVAGLELGADDYITKPFSLAVLRARVATQFRRVEQSRQTGSMTAVVDGAENDNAVSGVISGDAAAGTAGNSGEGWIGDGSYRFHFAKMLFYCGEEQIELSKSEQKLLRILIENKGITLTRDRLLDCIWSVDAAFVDENTLSVTVKRLRDKLGAQDRIKTVYGIGYRWE